MNNISINYFQEKLETLPDHLRWAIRDVDYIQELGGITKKYKLHIDQAATLESVTQHLILGDIDAATFIDTMFKEAYISSQVAADILVDIDITILKKIREKIETFEREELEVQQHRDEYMTPEEREIEEMNTTYRIQDEEYVRVAKEVDDQLKKEGYLEDGSNITEEDIAKAYGITVAEFLAQNKRGGIQEARESEEITTSSTPADIRSEKEDLMKELESPEKSFSKPLFTRTVAPTPAINKVESAPIAPDHQLQNTHVEEPFHDDINPTVTIIEPVETVPAPIKVETVQEKRPIETHIAPIIKKPAKIDLTHDSYREPIE